MLGLGFFEILILAVIVVLLFGAKKLPDIGRGLGQGLRNFKGEMKGETREEHERTLPPEDRGAPRE